MIKYNGIDIANSILEYNVNSVIDINTNIERTEVEIVIAKNNIINYTEDTIVEIEGQVYYVIEVNDTIDTIILTCHNIEYKLLYTDGFYYYDGDGFQDSKAYAGYTTPADHIKAILLRYINENKIDYASFEYAHNYLLELGILCDCEVKIEDNTTPYEYINSLCLNFLKIKTKKGKIQLIISTYDNVNYGRIIDDNFIVAINEVGKVKTEKYYTYNIAYDDNDETKIVQQSIGQNDVCDAYQYYIYDEQANWKQNELVGKYISIGTSNMVLHKILANTSKYVYFDKINDNTGSQAYAIVDTNNVYKVDYSDYPIKMKSAQSVASVGINVLLKYNYINYYINFEVIDCDLTVGDYIIIQSDKYQLNTKHIITNVRKNSKSNAIKITAYSYNDSNNIINEYDYSDITLTGRRDETNAYLEWSSITNAIYYKIKYDMIGLFGNEVITTNAIATISNLKPFLSYNFTVYAYDYAGREIGRSNILNLYAITQDVGYIDGSDGYWSDYPGWGYIDDYFYALTYKNISEADKYYLAKNNLVILDASQKEGTLKIQDFKQSTLFEKFSANKRSLGYIDTAGVSNYLAEFQYDDGNGCAVVNGFDKQITIKINGTDTVIQPGQEIPTSRQWYIKYGSDYCTYWYGTGFQLRATNANMREWFKTAKVKYTIGIFEIDTAQATVGTDTITFTTTKTYINNQWQNYFVCIKSGNNEYYAKILSNTASTITTELNKKISNGNYKIFITYNPYKSFDGLFMDDVWSEVYHNGTPVTFEQTQGTGYCESDFLEDETQEWVEGQFANQYVYINGQQLLIERNDETCLYFTGCTSTGNVSYTIKDFYTVEEGQEYWQGIKQLIQEVATLAEYVSYEWEGNDTKCQNGIIVLNTWPERWSVYQEYANALCNNYRHLIMFEALQSTWDMRNEVTRQYNIIDFAEMMSRWNNMKITLNNGKKTRLISLGYPYSEQFLLSHIATGLLLTDRIDNVCDMVGAGNIPLNQLYYCAPMARDININTTIGRPIGNYQQSNNDKYGIVYREFDGCYILYNPSFSIKTIQMSLGEDCISYPEQKMYFTGNNTIILPPMSATILYKNNDYGRDAYEYLYNSRLYVNIDSNINWIVFTQQGANKIGNNSVWLVNGYYYQNEVIKDGTQPIPAGTIKQLFHAGDGITTSVDYNEPDYEDVVLGQADEKIELSNKGIYAIVKIVYNTTILEPGTDYAIEQSGHTNAGWTTKIVCLNSDFDSDTVRVYYYAQTINSGQLETLPQGLGFFGCCYGGKNLTLKTGDINQEDCDVTLTEGEDYYRIILSNINTWQYRKIVHKADKSETIDIKLNANEIYQYLDNKSIQGIHWGTVDCDNCILVNANGTSKWNEKNGAIIETTKTIAKPKVLVYGFRTKAREDNGAPVPPADRVIDNWSIASILYNKIGVYYDDVIVTGDYDGVLNTSNDSGKYGSINGLLNDTSKGLDTIDKIIDYFDVIIMADYLTEFASGQEKTQWCSWLEVNDYTLIKNYLKRRELNGQKGLIIDNRGVLNAFVYAGLDEPVKNSLLNKKNSRNLTDVAGILAYGTIDVNDYINSLSELYIKDEDGNYLKNTILSDYRFIKNIDKLTDYIAIDTEPVVNIWEQNSEYIFFIPKSRNSKNYIKTKAIDSNNLYLKWYNYLDADNTDFEKYENASECAMPIKRMPGFLYNDIGNFNTVGVAGWSETLGNNYTEENIVQPTPIMGEFGDLWFNPIIKYSQDEVDLITYKFLYLLEADDENYKSLFTYNYPLSQLWEGFKGFYIASADKEYLRSDYPTFEINRSAFTHYSPGGSYFTVERWGYAHGSDKASQNTNVKINYSNLFKINTWSDDIQDVIRISYASGGQNKIVPLQRMQGTYIWPYEGKIVNQVKNYDGTVDLYLNASEINVADIPIEEPLATGTLLKALMVVQDTNYSLCRLSIATTGYTGKYIFIFTTGGIKIYQIIYSAGEYLYGERLKWNEIVIKEKQWILAPYEGDTIQIKTYGTAKAVKAMIVQSADNQNNIIDALCVRKYNADNMIKIYAPRLSSANNANAGYVYIYEEPSQSLDDTYRNFLGGRLVGTGEVIGADVCSEVIPEYGINTLMPATVMERATIGDLPYTVEHFEWAYGNNIEEFIVDKNTGLIAGQCYNYHGVSDRRFIVTSGCDENWIMEAISRNIGITITFENVVVNEGDEYYIYYNAIADMLRAEYNLLIDDGNYNNYLLSYDNTLGNTILAEFIK